MHQSHAHISKQQCCMKAVSSFNTERCFWLGEYDEFGLQQVTATCCKKRSPVEQEVFLGFSVCYLALRSKSVVWRLPSEFSVSPDGISEQPRCIDLVHDASNSTNKEGKSETCIKRVH